MWILWLRTKVDSFAKWYCIRCDTRIPSNPTYTTQSVSYEVPKIITWTLCLLMFHNSISLMWHFISLKLIHHLDDFLFFSFFYRILIWLFLSTNTKNPRSLNNYFSTFNVLQISTLITISWRGSILQKFIRFISLRWLLILISIVLRFTILAQLLINHSKSVF